MIYRDYQAALVDDMKGHSGAWSDAPVDAPDECYEDLE